MSRIRILNTPSAVPPREGPLPVPPLGPGLLTRRFHCDGESLLPGDCDVLMLQSVYQTVTDHLAADTTREHGGLLLGLNLAAPDGGTSVLIVHALPGKFTKGTPTSLTFTHETWEEFTRLQDQLEQAGLKLHRVGWYHSHPNINIFLSHWDLNVCEDFQRAAHIALVVDPVRDRSGIFVHGEEGYRTHHPQGFLEVCDLQRNSLVTWSNMHAVSEAPLGNGADKVSRNGHVPVAAPPVHRPAPAWSKLATCLTLLLALLGSLGWWNVLAKSNAIGLLEGRLSGAKEEAERLERESLSTEAELKKTEQELEVARRNLSAAEQRARQIESETVRRETRVRAAALKLLEELTPANPPNRRP